MLTWWNFTVIIQNLGIDQLTANAQVLVLAGSETTATLLSGLTYFLLQDSAAYQQLANEVRSTFNTDKQINFSSVNQLPYMMACLNEALRMYPPVANGLPRVVPKGGAQILGRYVPEQVRKSWYISKWWSDINHIHRHMWQLPSGRSTIVRSTSLSLILSTLNAFLVILDLQTTDEMGFNHSALAHEIALDSSR